MSDKTESNKKYYRRNNPYPIRLGDLKPKLQMEAFERDKSMHDMLRIIVEEYFERKGVEKSLKEIMEPLSKLK